MHSREPVTLWAEEGRQIAAGLGDEARLVKLETWTGMLANQRGDVESAARWARTALERAREHDGPSLQLAPAAMLLGLPPGTADVRGVPSPAQLVQLAHACGELSALDWIQPTAAVLALRDGDLARSAWYSSATLRRAQAAEVLPRATLALMCLFLLALRKRRPDLGGPLARHAGAAQHPAASRPPPPRTSGPSSTGRSRPSAPPRASRPSSPRCCGAPGCPTRTR